MPRIDVPELGPQLRGWRESQGCRRVEWARQLRQQGWHASTWRIVRILARAERKNQWKDCDPSRSLGEFEEFARIALVHSPRDREYFFERILPMLFKAHQDFIDKIR